MQQAHGHLAGTLTSVADAFGQPAFYAADLAPRGYVVIAADDTVEPVIAFSTSENFTPLPGNPLYELLRADLPSRLARAHSASRQPTAKWRSMQAAMNAPLALANPAALYANSANDGDGGAASISDVRVAPLLASKWNQTAAYGEAVFNYYTPPYAAGSVKNYYSGCVATMLGQIMRYHQWPQAGVGAANLPISVNGAPQQRALRGGDGAGGPYDWQDMALVSSTSMTLVQQQAIGALLADAGVASNTDYTPGGSMAPIRAAALTNVFQFASAAYCSGQLPALEQAIQANLDAGLPVGLGIQGGNEGHALVVDGYGYNGKTLYHHLNMGWGGADDAWYNLPSVDVGMYDFNSVEGALINIDPQLQGEIISGRIVDGLKQPVADTVVTVASGALVFTATTNAQGIYAVRGLLPNAAWTITPAADTWQFCPTTLTATTGHTTSAGSIGDRTGENFTSSRGTGAIAVTLNAGAVSAGGAWQIDGCSWRTSGSTVMYVPEGTHRVTFHAAAGWITPAAQPVTVAQSATNALVVNYTPKYSLQAAPDNTANGQVVANPAPGELGGYPAGTTVTLTATASAGYYFGGWLESGTLISTDATYTAVVRGARTLVANFAPDSLTGSDTQIFATPGRQPDIVNVLTNISASAGTASIAGVTQPVNGSVSINADGTITFTPAANFHGSSQFSVSISDGQGGSLTRTVTISNLFAASAGHYGGLVQAAQAAQAVQETSGYLRAAIASSGALSARLTYAGASYSLAGAFGSGASYTRTIPRKGASALQLSLRIDPVAGLTGTVTGAGDTSTLAAPRATYSTANPTMLAGQYALLIAANNSVPGNGCLSVTVSTAGNVTASGRLADGTPITTGGYLLPDGTAQWYTAAYNSAGAFLGSFAFDTDNTPACTGTYNWFRPASAATMFPVGFAETGSATGSILRTVKFAPRLRSSAPSQIGALLDGGSLQAPLGETGVIAASGSVVWGQPGPEKLALTVSSSGRVTGTFIDPATGKKRVLMGIWLQDQGIGGGFFIGDKTAGALTLYVPAD
jgi:hypothetical protein